MEEWKFWTNNDYPLFVVKRDHPEMIDYLIANISNVVLYDGTSNEKLYDSTIGELNESCVYRIIKENIQWFFTKQYKAIIKVVNGITVEFNSNGHITGTANVSITPLQEQYPGLIFEVDSKLKDYILRKPEDTEGYSWVFRVVNNGETFMRYDRYGEDIKLVDNWSADDLENYRWVKELVICKPKLVPKFKHEDRYIVFKLTDIAKSSLSDGEAATLNDICNKIQLIRKTRGKPCLDCVVVESDWPEYEPTWKAIQKRMEETK